VVVVVVVLVIGLGSSGVTVDVEGCFNLCSEEGVEVACWGRIGTRADVRVVYKYGTRSKQIDGQISVRGKKQLPGRCSLAILMVANMCQDWKGKRSSREADVCERMLFISMLAGWLQG
jgi:hypothetical protein